MSLYSEYVKERLNKEVIENENGFATYLFMDDGVYVEDIFVRKEYRDKGIAKEMLDQISIIAKEKGCKKMIGTVVPSTEGSTHSLQAAFSYGFKLDSCRQNLIVYTKEI